MSSPILFVCGHRKSGTTLLANLFDGHPDLAVLPHDIKILYAYFPRFLADDVRADARRARLRRLLVTDMRHQLEQRQLHDALDLDRYAERIFDGLEDEALTNIPEILSRVAEAVRSGRTVQHTVLKETSIEIYGQELLSWFPHARMLQLLRDPRDNFGALASGVASYYSKLGQSRRETLMSLLFRCRLGFQATMLLPEGYGERYRYVRFEDLANDPHAVMESVCDWLGVDLTDDTLRPTFLGRSTGGNSFDDIPMPSVTNRNVGRWRDRIDEWEAQVIEHVMGDLMERHGYHRVFDPGVSAEAAGRFYAWANDRYFFSDPYVSEQPLPRYR